MFSFAVKFLLLSTSSTRRNYSQKLINFISIDRFNWAEKSIEFCGDEASDEASGGRKNVYWKAEMENDILLFYKHAKSEKQIEHMEHWVRQKIIYWIIAFPNPCDASIKGLFAVDLKLHFIAICKMLVHIIATNFDSYVVVGGF